MTNPIPDVPTETLNAIAAQHSPEQAPPTPHSDPPSPIASQNPPIQNHAGSDSKNPNQDEDTLMEDPIQPQNTTDDPEANAPTPSPSVRRAPKRKKFGPKRTAQERKSREKLHVLVETLKPVPFVPAKALNFESHRSLLQRLGLWDFVHVEFDSDIRTDLLAQLIASYASRASYVNGVKILVNRADLARALKLPVMSRKNSATSAAATAVGDVGAEDIAFVDELVSNWMLLHDDMYIMPSDVLGLLKPIKEGNFEKVDWAGLMWSMLEKELKASPQLENCYYASHLQHLIKTQHKELLDQKPVVEAEVKGEGEEAEVKDEEEDEEIDEEEVDGNCDVKTGGVDESRVHELEEHNIELSLGQDNVENLLVEKEQYGGEHMVDFMQSKDQEPGMWFLDQKNCMGEPLLRQCNNSNVNDMDCGQMKEDEGETGQEQEEEDDDEDPEDEQDGGFDLSSKCIPMEGMPSGTGGFMQGMAAGQMPLSSGIDLRDNAVGDFLSARDDSHMMSGSSLFANGHKRDIGLDNHNPHHSLNGSNKRLRNDIPWNSKQEDFETCMEQMEHWMGKARMMYASKDQACEDITVNQQFLMNELQKRDSIVEHLHKARIEDGQKSQLELYRYEKELVMMQSLVEGYRKALKETQKAFAEYRARCPQADEPLYKDVPGSGGLVLSVMELEKERLKKEEEERTKLRELVIDFKKNCTDIEEEWMGQMGILKDHLGRVESLGDRLGALEDKVKLLKEMNGKGKITDPLECAPLSEAPAA